MKINIPLTILIIVAFAGGYLIGWLPEYQSIYEAGYDKGWNEGNWNVINAVNNSTEKSLEYNSQKHLDSLNIIVFKGEIMFDYYWSSKY